MQISPPKADFAFAFEFSYDNIVLNKNCIYIEDFNLPVLHIFVL